MVQPAEYGRLDFEQLLKFLDGQKRQPGKRIRTAQEICAYLCLRLEDSGVWNEEHLDLGEAERNALRWSPGRSSEPSLPFPFSAAKLAAFMIDGMGEELLLGLGEWADGPDQAMLSRLPEGDAHLKELLVEAYRSFRDAEAVVGPLDPALEENAQRLAAQRRKATSDANRKAAWRERGISEEERDIRLSGARTNTAAIVRGHEEAKAKADGASLTWRRAMVRQLLQDTPAEVPAGTTVREPLYRSRAQEDLIMATLERMQQDPLTIPDPAGQHAGVKKEVWVFVCNAKKVFSSRATFDKAWRRLKKDGRIRTLDQSG